MRAHFEYYIDNNFERSENTILYGKAIIVCSTKGHKLAWTPNQQRIFFYKDTMTYKELGKRYNLKEPTIYEIFKDATKKIHKVVELLLKNRNHFSTLV